MIWIHNAEPLSHYSGSSVMSKTNRQYITCIWGKKKLFSWTSALTLKWNMLFIFCDLHHLFQTTDLHSRSPCILPKPIICELCRVTLRLFCPSLCLSLFCVSLYTVVTVCLRSLLAGGGPGGSFSTVRILQLPFEKKKKFSSLLLNKQEQLLFPLHWLSSISPKHCIGFVRCCVRLVPLPFVSQLLLLRHLRLFLGSCGEEVWAGLPAFQQDVISDLLLIGFCAIRHIQ